MKYCYENAKNIEKILKIDFEVKRLASFNLTKIIMRDLDVKPTPSRDLDIKRDYQLILRYYSSSFRVFRFKLQDPNFLVFAFLWSFKLAI